MDEQNKNLFLATALSFVVILVWFILFPPQEPVEDPNAPAEVTQTADPAPGVAAVPDAAPGTEAAAPTGQPVGAAADAPRLPLETARLEGSIALTGGRLDDLRLKDYTVSLDSDEIVQVFQRVGSSDAYYTLYGWAPGGGLSMEEVPGANTVWSVETGETLTTETPVTLRWDSPSGLVFRRTIAVDEDYMFTVTQTVENASDASVSLAPYGVLARHGEPSNVKNFFILHEGGISMIDGELAETDYDDFQSAGQHQDTTMETAGWTGFTDHYWMSILIPTQPGTKISTFHNQSNDIYQTTARMPTMTVAPGQTQQVTSQLFAGAKEWETIREYQKNGVDRFLDSIDWGWFFFLTKPMFAVLHWLHGVIGNMGIAIIGLTVLLKILLFPLAYKSYASMAKMKELQPEMEKLKERAGDDREKLQKEMMALYKKEKVNPAAGCLPILLQIPIFFSLYKVIFVTLELRHAPFFGPFQDLSAPDPTSLYNLFGLLPWAAPEAGSILALVFIGILPILLGISMWLQQKLNPAPADPTQQMIFAWMPWVFMFMLGGFASGLVVYWITNNTITFTQQYLIMRSHGYHPDVLGNIRGSFKRGKKGEAAAKK